MANDRYCFLVLEESLPEGTIAERAAADAEPAAEAQSDHDHPPGGASAADSCGRVGTPQRHCHARDGTTAVRLARRPPVTGRRASERASAFRSRQGKPHRASVDVRSPRVTGSHEG